MRLVNDGFLSGIVDASINVPDKEVEAILNEYPIKVYDQSDRKGLNMASAGVAFKDINLILSDIQLVTNNKPYIKCIVSDGTATLPAKIWDNGNIHEVHQKLVDHPYIKALLEVNEFPKGSGRLDSVIKSHYPIEKELAYDLMLKSPYNIKDMAVEFIYRIKNNIQEPHRSIALFALQDHWNEFHIAPAAIKHHHNYVYGLLEHTLGMLRIADFLSQAHDGDFIANTIALANKVTLQHYTGLYHNYLNKVNPKPTFYSLDHLGKQITGLIELINEGYTLDIDLIKASIVWHDIGKIREYKYDGVIDMHPQGKLIGHMVYGVQMFDESLNSVPFNKDIEHYYDAYKHIILGHHGSFEYNSVSYIQSPEAHIVSLIDYIDSQMNGRTYQK